MNQNKYFKQLFSPNGMSIIMLVLFLAAIGITLQSLQTYHIYNSGAFFPTPVPTYTPRNRKITIYHPFHIKAPIINNNAPGRFAPSLNAPQPIVPQDILAAYHLPANSGQGTIAIIDSFHDPTAEHDLNVFSTKFNLPQCTSASGCFSYHYESGTTPPVDPTGQWEFEENLDIEYAHAIAPHAKILLIELNTDQFTDYSHFNTVLDYARNRSDVVAVSMSWQTSETPDEQTEDAHLISPSGAAFFAAAGDNGNGVGWPAISANVISVGGTTLTNNNNSYSETAWSCNSQNNHCTGGGISTYLSEPSFQSIFNIPQAQNKRGNPDIAAVADNTAMYAPDGNWYTVNGTSLATPIWAGISALGTKPLSNSLLYQLATSNYSAYFHDITSGTNGTCALYCSASASYDYLTGLGTPIGFPITGNTITPTSTPKPTGHPTPSPTSVVTPTLPPSPTATVIPTHTPTPSVVPSPTPSPTPDPNGVNLGFVIGLHGLGNAGDNANPVGGNPNPNHQTRSLTVTITDVHNTPVSGSPFQTPIHFDNTSGFFTGTLDAGALANGNYQIKVKSDGFLERLIPNFISVTKGQVIQLPTIFLVNGDIDNNNQLDAGDYSLLADCFGAKQQSKSCKTPPTLSSAGSDLNDDGVVDGIDYNLYIREISVQFGAQ